MVTKKIRGEINKREKRGNKRCRAGLDTSPMESMDCIKYEWKAGDARDRRDQRMQ